MTLQRWTLNVQTGERVLVDLTPKEEAEAWARTAAEAAKPAPKSAAAQLVDQLKADPEALAALKAELAK